MNTLAYLALAALVAVVLADDTRTKKEAVFNPYGQTKDVNQYLTTGGDKYFNQQQPYYQGNFPYNQQYYQQPNYPFNQQYNLQQPYQRYNGPYNNAQQYYPFNQLNNAQQYYPYNQYNNYPAQQQYYNQQHYGYQQQHPHGYQNAYNYNQYNPYNPFGVRQAPVYPSPGAQPVYQPVPHPFYHAQGTYYPTTTEINKPATTDPKKIY